LIKRFIFSILSSGLLLLAACSPDFLQQSTDATATKMAGDLYATQTALVSLQQMVNATATKMAEGIYATQTQAAHIPTSASPTTSQAVVNIDSMNVRAGPGIAYAVQKFVVRGDILIILGQAYNCGWLEVKMPDGQTGWVSATYLTYNLACSDIAKSSIPPAPTSVAQSSSCDASSSIVITNDTGGSVTLYLNGPASFSFNLGTGESTVSVCPGSYSYTAYGCGGASETGNMSNGESHRFYCSG
jgi:uncharacterized protein YraI